MDRTFSTLLVTNLAGVSDDTLENWAQRGFLRPSGGGRHGRRRLYTFRDLVAIRVVDELRGQGIDVRHMHGVLEYLRGRHGLDRGAIAPQALLLTDGDEVYEVDGGHRLPSQWRRPDRAAVLLPLGHIVTRLREAVDQADAA